jgi:acetolactate synthase-1/3 small subunit
MPRVVDVASNSMIIEMAGTPAKVENFIEVVRPYGVKEMMRTGRVAMVRGTRGHNANEYIEATSGNGAAVSSVN